MFLSRQRIGVIILFLADLVILFLIILLGFYIRSILPRLFAQFPFFTGRLADGWWFFPIWMAIISYEGAYTKKFTLWDEVKLLWKVTIFATISILTIVSLGQLSHSVSRTVILLQGFLSLIIFPSARIAVKRLLLRSGLLNSNVLILGTGEAASLAVSALISEPNMGYHVIGYVKETMSDDRKELHGLKVYGYINNVERYIRNCDVQNAVIAVDGMSKEDLSRLVDKMQQVTRSILYIPDYSGIAVMGTELVHFFHDQVFALEIKNNLARPINYLTKRSLDLCAGLILLVIFSIPIGLISLLIRLTSKGPSIFVQERIGKNRRPFQCFKFRTMYQDADNRLERILSDDPAAKKEWETFWKLKNDPRVTPVGRFLRRTSLDEIPQLFNVLLGHMSLVGPRPYLPREWHALKEQTHVIHGVRPGITGLWQVSGRSDSSYAQRISLDSWYVRNWNLWLDIVILLKTFMAVISKRGAR